MKDWILHLKDKNGRVFANMDGDGKESDVQTQLKEYLVGEVPL